jgi:methylamine dehydrogenase accessory protein MauD
VEISRFWQISHVVLWIVVLAQGALLIAMARLLGRLNRRVLPVGARMIDPGPEIGAGIPEWVAVDYFGKTVEATFPRGRGFLFVYISPHCSVCAALLPSAKRIFREVGDEAEGVWVMVSGSRERRIEYANQSRLTGHPVFGEEDLPPQLRLEGAPFALWVGADGMVRAKGMVNHREHLESLRNAASTGHPTLESKMAEWAEAEDRAARAASEPDMETRGEVR